MFMNDVYKKEEIRNIVIGDLRGFGIKYRQKKLKHVQESKGVRRVFKTDLCSLPSQTVTLRTGQQLKVPKIMHELCTFILSKAETEGLFRKAGSKSRQSEIKLLLDAGCRLGDDHHEIDVANVLKTFLRELPEPLIPYSFHEIFLRCLLHENKKIDLILLACLLLPMEYLNSLAYLLQFLNQITEYSYSNKMDSYNIAVIIGPTILPVEEKLSHNTQYRITKTCELSKLLVENANAIGVLPEHIIERIAMSVSSGSSMSDEDVAVKKKKKRRSGSLTRMFSGLKKIVGSKINEEDAQAVTVVMPDLLVTPRIEHSVKKRKIENGNLSHKKRKMVLNNLPEGVLRTPLSQKRTPVNINPNAPETRSQWSVKAKLNKTGKTEDEKLTSNSKTGNSTMERLERRWSAVSHSTAFRRSRKRSSTNLLESKKTSSLSNLLQSVKVSSSKLEAKDDSVVESDYVKVSKTEYEEIKNRVSEIERRISIELDNAQVNINDLKRTEDVINDDVENVQTEYEKTLTHVGQLSTTTDQLAKQFSKDLKIRKYSDQKVFRSPSARKIGSLRRQSRELHKHSNKLTRNQSWHVTTSSATIPRVSLQKNTRYAGYSPLSDIPTPTLRSAERNSRRTALRASSFQGSPTFAVQKNVPNSPLYSNIREKSPWVRGERFFDVNVPRNCNKFEDGRASLAKLRKQNAGMVLAKAKLFDGFSETEDISLSSSSLVKINSQDSFDKVMKNDENKVPTNKILPKRNSSPRKRKLKCVNVSEKENYENYCKTATANGAFQNNILKNHNRMDTPGIPAKNHSDNTLKGGIKKNNSKSPKRLHQTPKQKMRPCVTDIEN